MGGKYEAQMCVAIIEDLFGKIVAKVVETIIKESCQMPALIYKLKGQVAIGLIKKSLATLIKFGFVKFYLDTNMRTLYVADLVQIKRVLMAPRACLIAKTLYGAHAEAICEELVAQGKLTCSNVIRRCQARDETSTLNMLKKSFTDLANAQFVMRLPPLESELHGCPQFETSFDPFVMPAEIMQKKKEEPENSTNRKRKGGSSCEDADEGQYWRINWNRFEAYIRDEMIVESLIGNATTSEDRTLALTSQVLRLMFKMDELRQSSLKAPTLESITAATYDILKIAKENEIELSKADVEFACQVLLDETDGVVRKIGDSAGGLWQIDVKRSVEMICKSHCEALIREQFEGRAIRIMRLLETRHYLDEEQVEKLSMMSGKEAREMLYALVEEGYVFTKAVGRTNDFQPARTFYLYYVDLTRTIRGLTEYTCKLIRNLIIRDGSERKENKHLLDKNATVGPIVDGIRANEELDEETKMAQIAEVEEMYLPGPDRAQLNKFRQAQATLLAAEDQSAKVLAMFNLFLKSN